MHSKRKIDSNYCNSCLLFPVVTHLKEKKGKSKIQPIADRVAQNLEIIFDTFST